ncbi:MAG: TetR/AcrR family transcriptional regulator [Myxococcota bacterium]
MTTVHPLPRPSSQAWDGDPPHRQAARSRLIEAAARCVVRDGLAASGISAVAAEAGVSRPTVYRYFDDRHALILATLLHAGGELGRDLADHLRAVASPRRMAVEAMLYVLEEVPRNPLLHAMWSSTALDADMLADFTGPDVVAMSKQALARLIDAAGWSDAEADEAVETMLRMLLSLLVAPAPKRDADALRTYLHRRLIPALGIEETT